MFGFGGPIFHFPQIFLLELFDRDQVELAFLMGKLCEAYGTQEWALLALGVETDYFYLLVFMLFIHAVEF